MANSTLNGTCEFTDGECRPAWEYCCTRISCDTSPEDALINPTQNDQTWAYPKLLEGAKTTCGVSDDTTLIIGVVCGVGAALILALAGVLYWMLSKVPEEEEEVPEDVHDLSWHVSIHTRLGTVVPPKKGIELNEGLVDGADGVDGMSPSEMETVHEEGATLSPGLSSDDKIQRMKLGERLIELEGYGGVQDLGAEQLRPRLVRSHSVDWSSCSSDASSRTTSMTLSSDLDSLPSRSSLARCNSWNGLTDVLLERDEELAYWKVLKRRDEESQSAVSATVVDPDLSINPKSIKIDPKRKLGSGSYGVVYKGKYKSLDAAIKRVDREKVDLNDLWQEVGINVKAAKSKSEHLVRFYGACTRGAHWFIVMELVAGGNLYSHIHHRKRRRMTYLEVLQAAKDIAEGLRCLHELDIIHGDLQVRGVSPKL